MVPLLVKDVTPLAMPTPTNSLPKPPPPNAGTPVSGPAIVPALSNASTPLENPTPISPRPVIVPEAVLVKLVTGTGASPSKPNATPAIDPSILPELVNEPVFPPTRTPTPLRLADSPSNAPVPTMLPEFSKVAMSSTIRTPADSPLPEYELLAAIEPALEKVPVT